MTKLYKFRWDCGRQGHVDGVFTAEEDEVKSTIGKRIYFGEILGKHSEIFGWLDKEDIEMLSDDPKVVDIFETKVGPFGYNPLEYVREKEEE